MGRVGRAFVVMSGLPGSGKTTLGRRLAALLALAMLDKDDILDALLNTVGSPDPQSRQMLSRASDAVMETIAANSPGAVLSSFWRRERLTTTSGTPTAWLHQLPDARLVEVHCVCPPTTAAERFQARRRHRGHHDRRYTTDELIDRFTRLDAEGPLHLGHLVQVDTSSDVDPGPIAAAINGHLYPLTVDVASPMDDDLEVRRLTDEETTAVLAAGLGLSRLDPATLRSPSGFYLVAWCGAVPVGHAHLAVTDPPALQDVLVVPAARGRGVGTALVEAACGQARALGAVRMQLKVSADNPSAGALYARLGFADAGQPPQHVHGPVQIRTGVIEVDEVLTTLERPLPPT